MTFDSGAGPDVSRVAAELAEEFAGKLPARRVYGEVAAARSDLDGQVVPASIHELAHRLARYRLQRLVNGDGQPMR